MRVLGKCDLQNSILLDELQILLTKYIILNADKSKNEQNVTEIDINTASTDMAISVAPTDELSDNYQ